jgi:hypothetical protein
MYHTSADGNAASSLDISLPLAAPDVNSYTAVSANQLVNTTWSDPGAYIDQLDNTAANRTLKFRKWTTCTDGQACSIEVSGAYEI